MDAVDHARLIARRGIEGNADLGGRRQVTLIASERWDRVDADLGTEVDPVLRRANLLVSGIDLEGSRDRVLVVGECRLRIGGETRPCRLMDEQHAGLQDALDADWGGGAYAEVVDGGTITVGDWVAFDDA